MLTKEDVNYLEEMAAAGYVKALYYLGYLYLHGESSVGIERDGKRAMALFREAALQDHVEAISAIGIMFFEGIGVETDDSEALRWLFRSGNYPVSQNMIGWAYDHGRGLPKSHSKALIWYRKAAAQGDLNAINNIGISYEGGLGVDRDYKEAVKCFREAAEQGLAQAQYNMAVMYINGAGVKPCKGQAIKWLQRAIDQDFEEAQEVLDSLQEDTD